MSIRARSTEWEIISKDEIDALATVDYEYPYCRVENHELVLIEEQNIDKIETDWETDQRCAYCEKEVIVECIY